MAEAGFVGVYLRENDEREECGKCSLDDAWVHNFTELPLSLLSKVATERTKRVSLGDSSSSWGRSRVKF